MIRQNFNADWTVEKGDGNSRMNSFLGNTQTQTVHLPYDAMIHEARTPDTKNGAQTGFYPGGEYIFQKHFTAPQAWQGKPVSLVFEGVYQTALVYLNGWLLTRNVNGYAEFTVEAGPYLKYGADNLLKVIADNSLEPNSRWYTGSGIYRPVRLLVGNKVYLPQDTVRITTREADEGFALLDGSVEEPMKVAIRAAGALLAKRGYVDETYADAMVEREKLVSTYMGMGVAIPHGTSQKKGTVKKSGVVLLQYPQGVDFGDEKAYLVFGIAGVGNDHLDLLGNVCEILEDEDALEQLKTTSDMNYVLEHLQ